MVDKVSRISTTDGRHRVAYEMALLMWRESNDHKFPSIGDKDKFLSLVKECTAALAHIHG